MKLFSHTQSNRLYEVLSITEARAATATGGLTQAAQAAEVFYRAVGNGGSRFKLSKSVFDRKFRPFNGVQADLVNRFLIELETYQGEVNVALLTKLEVILDGPETDIKLQELFRSCDAGPGVLVRPTIDFSRVALTQEGQAEVDAIVTSINLRSQIDEEFHLAEICQVRRSVYSLYGPPGTGKTITCNAIAKKLGHLLYQADYSDITSASGRREIFKRAKRYNAILFLDEADSLCAARTFWPSATAQRLNVDKNVFFQALDAYDGPVLMATNLLNHFDEAMMRRCSRHVRFLLPDVTMRERLFQLHLPAINRVDVDFTQASTASDGLSGGDIQNVCFNAIDSACIDGTARHAWKVKTSHILVEIGKIKQAKKDNLKGNEAVRRGAKVPSDRPDVQEQREMGVED
jgi:hypothetical protein